MIKITKVEPHGHVKLRSLMSLLDIVTCAYNTFKQRYVHVLHVSMKSIRLARLCMRIHQIERMIKSYFYHFKR